MIATSAFSIAPNDFALTAGVPRANIRKVSFPAAEFVNVPNVPIFGEHTTVCTAGRFKGRSITFDGSALIAVMQRCNRRIADDGSYAMMVIGHSPPPILVQRGEAKAPEVVGYAGPFRMGQMQNADGRLRWVILADFHYFIEDYPRAKKFPRRSPEVWLEERFQDMFLDPIALLGPEVPRLDMGMVYSRWAGDRHQEFYCREDETLIGYTDAGNPISLLNKEFYSAVAAPSAGSVFVTSHDAIGYAAQEEDLMTPDETKAIVDALMQTAPMQWVVSKMQSEGSPGGQPPGGAPPPDAGAAPPGGPPPGGPPQQNAGLDPAAGAMPPTPPAAPPPITPPTPAAMPTPPTDPNAPPVQPYGGSDDDEDLFGDEDEDDMGKVKKYEGLDPATGKPAAGTVGDPAKTPGSASVEKYQRLERAYKNLKKQIDVERYSRINAERIAKLESVSREDGIVIDVQKAMSKCAATKMSDELFALEVNDIREHYARIPQGSLVVADFPSPSQRHKDREAASNRAFEITRQKQDRGESVDYNAELREQLKLLQ